MPNYVVRFAGYRPPARDDNPWTQARLEEAAASAGPWTVLETRTLTPADANPASPAPRSFTTELATLPAGWYRITWVDATGDTASTAPVTNGPTYMPSVDRVATIIRSYTTLKGGGEAGTFTADTDPTAAEVQDHIVGAASHVAVKVGLTIRPELNGAAANVIALRAAIFTVLSSFSEQVNEDTSPVDTLRELYTEEMDALVEAIRAGAASKARSASIRTPSRLETECAEAEAAAAAEAAP